MDWRGFELHPETPAGGKDLSKIFPGAQAEQFQQYILDFAAQSGLADLNLSSHIPSTRAPLAVTEYAREEGLLHPFKEAAMAAHFREGLDIERPEVLAELAQRAGLDPDGAVDAAGDPKYLDRVDALRDEAHGLGVSGIPTFFFGDGPPIVGCEPLERLSWAAERAGAVKR